MNRAYKITKYYPWILVGLLWVIALLNYLDRLLIASMREPIISSLTISDAQFGLLTSIFLWVYGVLSPFGGYVADRYSRKMVILISLLTWSAFTFWSGIVQSFEELLLARAFMGISEACYIPAALALIADYHSERTRSLATGLHISGLYAGMALGGVGGFIADAWGWRYGFQLFGLAGITYAVIVWFFLKDKPRKDTGTPQNLPEGAVNEAGISIRDSLRKLFGTFSFRILMLYNCAIGMTFWIIYSWLPTFFREQYNLRLGEAGISATAYIQVASFIGVVAGGYIADRWSAVNVRGRIYLPVIGFTLGCPLLFLMASTSVFGVAVAGIIGFGLARGFHDSNLMPVMCQVIDRRYRATGYGFLNMMSTLAGGIMVLIGGILRDNEVNLSLIFRVSAVILLLSSWLLLSIKPKAEQ